VLNNYLVYISDRHLE
jgi:hypothetical protein